MWVAGNFWCKCESKLLDFTQWQTLASIWGVRPTEINICNSWIQNIFILNYKTPCKQQAFFIFKTNVTFGNDSLQEHFIITGVLPFLIMLTHCCHYRYVTAKLTYLCENTPAYHAYNAALSHKYVLMHKEISMEYYTTKLGLC